MLTQYAETMPQNWQQFGQNMAQAYPTPATGASRDQIMGAVTQAAVNAGPLMTVYHGSPHRFDKFDESKIGTGEGHQAYGHGLYLAENPSVAREYAEALGGDAVQVGSKKAIPKAGSPADIALAHLASVPPDSSNPYAQAAKSLQVALDESSPTVRPTMEKAYQSLLKMNQKNAKAASGGNMYSVDLPDEHIAKMLDWDKPVSQQSPEAQKALRAMLDKARKSFPQIDSASDPMAGQVHHLYSQHRGGNSQAVADELRAAGIPGIRYLDGGSRSGGQGTSNFVVFPGNEGLLKILDRK